MTDETNTDNPEQRHEPNAADAQALAQAGAQAAAQAQPGTDQATLKRMIREAVKEEADERNLKGVGDAEAQMIAGAVIQGLEARGAFADPPAPEPVNPPANANPGNGGNSNANPDNGGDGNPGDETPQRKTFAEKYLRG